MTILISVKYSIKYKFIQLNIKKIILAIKSKSKNNISPLSSLSISLAAKIGVGSLSGIALALFYGGLGSIFFMMIISLLVSIITYIECILGIKHRDKINNFFIGGPVLYIKKCLGNKGLSILYGIFIIIIYSGLFLSIQSNTIVKSLEYYNISPILVVSILCLVTYIIMLKGMNAVKNINNKLVPIMLLFYLILGIYIAINNNVLLLFKRMISEAFKLKSILPVFLVGMQRAIFVTESGIGTSAISASICDNDGHKQGLLEVLGIHITTFIVCLTTFIIIGSSDYMNYNYISPNGIEIVLQAFNYHFGFYGMMFLSIITIMFAFSTIISGYFFGEGILILLTNKKSIKYLFRLFVITIIFISGFITPSIIWNLTDFFVAILMFINIYSISKINSI